MNKFASMSAALLTCLSMTAAVVAPSMSGDDTATCFGCYAQPSSGTAGGGITFPQEPTFANGTCLGQIPECTATACKASGKLTFTNNTHTNIYYSDDGGVTITGPVAAGQSVTININSLPIACGGEKKWTFYTNPSGAGQIMGAWYTLRCSACPTASSDG